MRAAIYERPGSPEVLRIEDAPDPVCAVDDVFKTVWDFPRKRIVLLAP